jgi:hypothetical protein
MPFIQNDGHRAQAQRRRADPPPMLVADRLASSILKLRQTRRVGLSVMSPAVSAAATMSATATTVSATSATRA